MDYWAITNDKYAETEMGKDSFLDRKILNALSTRVPGAEKVHKQKKRSKSVFFLNCAVVLSIHIYLLHNVRKIMKKKNNKKKQKKTIGRNYSFHYTNSGASFF